MNELGRSRRHEEVLTSNKERQMRKIVAAAGAVKRTLGGKKDKDAKAGNGPNELALKQNDKPRETAPRLSLSDSGNGSDTDNEYPAEERQPPYAQFSWTDDLPCEEVRAAQNHMINAAGRLLPKAIPLEPD
jgi:hypothetical protein